MKKHCPHCMMKKPLSDFHRDIKSKDGHSARCANCRNLAKRKKNPYKAYNGKPLVEKMFNEVMPEVRFVDMKLSESQKRRLASQMTETKKIVVEPEEPIVDIGYALNAITARHNRFFTFQVSKDSVLLTLHGSPQVSFKGTAKDVIEAAMK